MSKKAKTMGLMMKTMTLKIHMKIVGRRHMKAMKKTKVTMTRMENKTKKQSFKLFPVARK